ncbi:MAG: glycosyltransferase [Pseudomonadales bacterium]|nr:glycosyltransferase [Pseudomonadales bacterium]
MGMLAQSLVANGHEVIWWTSTFDHYNRIQRFDTDKRVEVQPGYLIQFLKGSGYRKNVSFFRVIENILINRKFRKLSRNEEHLPDVILASMPTAELCLAAVEFGKKNNVPVFLDIRDLWPDVFEDIVISIAKPFVRLLSMPFNFTLRKACLGATGITGLTNEFLLWAAEKAGREVNTHDRVFPMAYINHKSNHSELSDSKEFWDQLGVTKRDDRLIVVFFGALGRTNDLKPIVQAARFAAEQKLKLLFVICGKGEHEHYIRDEAYKLDTLIMAGWVNQSQISVLLNIADIGIAPYINSANYLMNIPNKPAEYLSGGLGIALSLSAGALYNQITEFDCGFSYENNPTLLIKELAFLTKHPRRLDQLKRNAIEVFNSQFNGVKVYNEFVNFLEVQSTTPADPPTIDVQY